MKSIFLPLFFALSVPTVSLASDDQCDLFEKAVKTSIGNDLPSELEAGKTYKFKSSLKIVDDTFLAKINSESWFRIWFLFSNGIPGSSKKSTLPSYDTTGILIRKNGDIIVGENTLDLGVNFQGKYSFSAYFSLQTPDGVDCYGQLQNEQSLEFKVKNISGTVDILPPVFSSSRILSKEVRPGGSFVVETKVKDQSPICGMAEKLSGICNGVWHVALASNEGFEINSFEPNALLNDGTVVTLVKVPKDTKPGHYRLTVHDISDIYENLFVDIPTEDAPFIEVLPAD
jgi:hypothetical protein